MFVAVPGSSTPLSVSAMRLGPFFCLRLHLLCLYLCLVCRLLRCCVCGSAWVVCSSVCICYILEFVPPSVSMSALSVPIPGLLASPSISAVFACAWVVRLYFIIFLL